MNMWGYTPDFMKELEEGFVRFLSDLRPENEAKAEYLLPTIMGQLLKEGRTRISVLETKDRWFGVTYREDIPEVKAGIQRLLNEECTRRNCGVEIAAYSVSGEALQSAGASSYLFLEETGMKIGFDNEKYLKIQSEHIKERISHFGDKLYLEFGGKLFDDFHASRVLPGFAPDSKLRMLLQMADMAEIVIVISAVDIEKNKVRGDLGITYDVDVLRLIEEYENKGLYVGSIVITHYEGQSGAKQFKETLEKKNIRVYLHYTIEGYPGQYSPDCEPEGFGKKRLH